MASNTAVVLVDPLNGFLHSDVKINNLVRESLQVTDTVKHMKDLVRAARSAEVPIYYALHQPYRPGNYDGWQHMTQSHYRNKQLKVFEEGSWGAQITQGLEPRPENGDVVVSKHWNSRYGNLI
jgi:nicotinamidase-related amidase